VPTAPTVLASDAAHALVSLDRIVVAVWRGAMTSTTVRALDPAVASAARQFPGEVVVALVVEQESPVPGDDVRKAFTENMRANRAVRCTVVVAEGSGFRISIVRSVVTGLIQVTRPGQPIKVTSTLPEGAKWACLQGATRGDLELEREIVRVAEAARARIGAR
jgi:hypothetical protein